MENEKRASRRAIRFDKPRGARSPSIYLLRTRPSASQTRPAVLQLFRARSSADEKESSSPRAEGSRKETGFFLKRDSLSALVSAFVRREKGKERRKPATRHANRRVFAPRVITLRER